MLKDLLCKNRSYRRFDHDFAVAYKTLEELVELARLSASTRNLQALKFYLSVDAMTNALIFPHLLWAGYLADWDGPTEEEKPASYIIIINDPSIGKSQGADEGIAALAILLGAVEMGLGGCIIGSVVHRGKLIAELRLPPHSEIKLVIALGKPAEKVQLDALAPDGDIKYWRDSQSVHHVPKRNLSDIILPGVVNK